EYCLSFLTGTGQGNRHRTDHVGDLNGGQSHTAGRGTNQYGFAGLQIADIDQRAVGGDEHHPAGCGLYEGQIPRMLDQRVHENINQLAIHPVISKRKSRDYADGIANVEAGHIRAERFHEASSLITQDGRKAGFDDVLAGSLHDFCAIDSDGFDTNLNLSLYSGYELYYVTL